MYNVLHAGNWPFMHGDAWQIWAPCYLSRSLRLAYSRIINYRHYVRHMGGMGVIEFIIIGVCIWWLIGFTAYCWSLDWDISQDGVVIGFVVGMLGPTCIPAAIEIKRKIRP